MNCRQPSTPPSVAAQASGGGVTVEASWNGATDVASWRVLSGPSHTSLAAVADTGKTGFETTIRVPAPGAYVQVQALGASGETLGTSTAIQPSHG